MVKIDKNALKFFTLSLNSVDRRVKCKNGFKPGVV